MIKPMSKHTLEARLCAGLVASGWTESPGRSGKYRTFTKAGMRPMLVGPSGALRSGRTVSQSFSLLMPRSSLYDTLLEKGEAALTPVDPSTRYA